MKNIKDINQLKLFDPWDHISPKKRELLDSSWPGLFQKEILPLLPASKLGCRYSLHQNSALFIVIHVVVNQKNYMPCLGQ